jgi:hypothetical protein
MTYAIGQNTSTSYTAAEMLQTGLGFGLGDRYTDSVGKEWVWVTAATAVTQYDVVFFDVAYSASTLSTSNDARGNLVAVAPIAIASGSYGWVQVKGPTTMNVLASCAANVRLNTTATGGSLDDDGTTGAMAVDGIYLTTARAASPGSAPGILNYPAVGVTL